MFDVVIQGPHSSKLLEIIESYRKPYIKNIIYSGWEDDLNYPNLINVIQTKSPKPQLAGGGNINLQLQTTKAGLKFVTSDLVLKVRSDLIIEPKDLERLEDYYLKNKKILTISICPDYPFFTWDFMYFGHKQDLTLLFNAPFDNNPNYYPNLLKAIIPETYLTAQYIANFDTEVMQYCQDPEHYLVQNRPGYLDSKILSSRIINNYFSVLPPIDIIWTKYHTTFNSTKGTMNAFGRKNDIFSTGW